MIKKSENSPLQSLQIALVVGGVEAAAMSRTITDLCPTEILVSGLSPHLLLAVH